MHEFKLGDRVKLIHQGGDLYKTPTVLLGKRGVIEAMMHDSLGVNFKGSGWRGGHNLGRDYPNESGIKTCWWVLPEMVKLARKTLVFKREEK